ncbi:hypothetical protein Bbelb_435120 [Branchiostoma belcheri]|nr:hypothetical protein Bbelb_437840 [Branchiostoma belcheri]KAI8478758.1 hypothetical protein Bbelb_435120 [Branchiostoma belcheri]
MEQGISYRAHLPCCFGTESDDQTYRVNHRKARSPLTQPSHTDGYIRHVTVTWVTPPVVFELIGRLFKHQDGISHPNGRLARPCRMCAAITGPSRGEADRYF